MGKTNMDSVQVKNSAQDGWCKNLCKMEIIPPGFPKKLMTPDEWNSMSPLERDILEKLEKKREDEKKMADSESCIKYLSHAPTTCAFFDVRESKRAIRELKDCEKLMSMV